MESTTCSVGDHLRNVGYLSVPRRSYSGMRFIDSANALPPTAFAAFLLSNLRIDPHEFSSPVLDIGTGAGILALSLVHLGYSEVHATDISLEAVLIARQNAYVNGLHNSIRFLVSDSLSALKSDRAYSLILCNPPMFTAIPKPNREHTLDLAFFSRPEAHSMILEVCTNATFHLLPHGRLVYLMPSFHPADVLFATLEHRGLKPRICAQRSFSLHAYEMVMQKRGIDSLSAFRNAEQYCLNNGISGFFNDSRGARCFKILLVEATSQ